MSEIRWTWDDARLVRRSVSKASPFAWKSAKPLEAIAQLERQRLRDQRRPVRMSFRANDFRFANVKHAIDFLRPHADRERATVRKQRQPWENIDSLLGDSMPESSKTRVRGALHCTHGHPIQKKSDGGARSNGWFQEKRACHACETTISQHTTHWRCTANCNYNVCNHCFLSAVKEATQIFAEKSPDFQHLSEASTSEGPPSVESVVEGPRIELQVQAADRKEIFIFDMRPLDIQLAELAESLGLPSKQSSAACSSHSPHVLVRSCSSEIEILRTEAQLQSLVPLTVVTLDTIDSLVATHLNAVSKAPTSHVGTTLRHLLAIVCAGEDLAREVFEQNGFTVLRNAIQSDGTFAELACTGISALLKCEDRRQEAMGSLRESWHDVGHALMHNLLTALCRRQADDSAPEMCQTATLTLLLWLLEDISGAASVAHAVAQGTEAEHDEALYPHIVSAAESQIEGFRGHASRLILCMMLRASAYQVAEPDLGQDIRQEIAAHVSSSSLGALGRLEELVSEHGSTELLEILTTCCADSAASKLPILQQEVDQLRDEKKFNGLLQGRLRQSHKAMREMIPFVRVGDEKIEETLNTVVRHGWESMDWPEGYTLLHFLCEYTYDAGLLKLVGELCTDLEARDDRGNRPIDYALRNPHPHVAQCLVEMSQDRVANGLRSLHAGQTESHASVGTSSSSEGRLMQPHIELEEMSAESSEVSPSLMQVDADEDVPKQDSDEKQVPDKGSGGTSPKESGPDASNLGTVFMLRTQLASVTRENINLRDKASELEMLRTRLAILTEENRTLQETSSQRPQIIASSHRSDAQSVSPTHGEPKLPESGRTQEPADGEDVRKTSADKREASVDKGPQPTVSKGAGKGKGKSSPPTPGPASSSSSGLADTKTDSASDAVNESVPPTISAMPKGKGKGNGKSGPAAPPAPSSGSSETAKGKAKGKGTIEPSKPTVAPNQELKTLPWTRFVKGAQIQEGATIWDHVNNSYDLDLLPVDEIECRFSKSAGIQKVEKVETVRKKAKAAKLDSIAQDQRFTVEVSLRTLPPGLNTGHKAVTVITELNRALLPIDSLNTLHRFLCPTAEQQQELRGKRESGEQEYQRLLETLCEGDADPEPFRWDPVEQYMEDLSLVPACSMRLSTLAFLAKLPDVLAPLEDNLDRFEQMVLCFHNSKELPSLLAVVLAFGNYLNGGKNEKRLGQADGFHIEMLGRPGGLDVVNDPQGRNVRQLIFKTFFEKCPGKAEKLLLELWPTFSLVQRRLGKDSDGVPQVNKTVRVQIEDIDKQLVTMQSEMHAKSKELKEGLKLIADPADKFVVEIPEEFEREKQRFEELIARKDLVLQQFKALTVAFKAETFRGDAVIINGQIKDGNPREEMTSDVWCKIWDDFFVPKEAMLRFDEKKQKEIIDPRFCKDAAISVESLEILWRLREEKPPSTRPKRDSNAKEFARPAAARKRNSF